ncbi:MAG: sensor histidine kinase [Gemmatimonadota bacterium]
MPSRESPQPSPLRFWVIGSLLALCALLEYYCHRVLGMTAAYPHAFYVPIVVATLWWRLRGVLLVSLLLAALHLSSYLPVLDAAVVSRSLTLVFIGAVLGTMTSRRRQAEIQLRAHQRQLRALASDLVLTEERERRLLAEELHDSIGQALAVTKIRLGSLRAAVPAGAVGQVEGIRTLVDQTIQDVRSLTFELSPPILYELGLEPAVEWLAELMQAEHGLEIAVDRDDAPRPLGNGVPVLLFRAVRELLLNAVKHAQARRVVITVRRAGGAIEIAVCDDGLGFDAAQLEADADAAPGFGLLSIRERLSNLGGAFRIESQVGHGTRATLTAPLAAE